MILVTGSCSHTSQSIPVRPDWRADLPKALTVDTSIVLESAAQAALPLLTLTFPEPPTEPPRETPSLT
jgi:hypothetical protein